MLDSKIQKRQELARAVGQLDPANMGILVDYTEQLKEMFPGDNILLSLCQDLETVEDRVTDETDPQFLDCLNQLRAHVSETYRLDRRILRNRRTSVQGLTPERDGVEFLDYSSTIKQQIFQAKLYHYLD